MDPTNSISGATAAFAAAAAAGTATSDGQHDNGPVDAQNTDSGEQYRKGFGHTKKAASWKYIKEEKMAILAVLLDVGMELWEMEKPINKPWRMLFWEQRVALPVRERLKNSTRYTESGFDINQRFSGNAGVDNLRKWVRSQRTQELERVEGERQRLPGSPPGRPLSEVQQLRARAFEEITNTTLEKDEDGVAREVVRLLGGGDTQAVAAAAAAAAAASAAAPGGGVQVVRNGVVVPSLASLFSPPSRNGGGVPAAAPAPATAPAPAGAAQAAEPAGSGAPSSEEATAAGTPAVAPVNGGTGSVAANGGAAGEVGVSASSPSSSSSAAASAAVGTTPNTRENGDARSSSPPLPQTQPQQQGHNMRPPTSAAAAAVAAAVAAATKKPFLAPRPLGVAGAGVDPAVVFSSSSSSSVASSSPGVSGTIDVGGGSGGLGDAYIAAAGGARTAETEGVGLRRRLAASESTPDDFRLGGGVGVGGGNTGGRVAGGYASASAAAAAAAAATAFAPSASKRQRKTDHTEVVNRVMAQIGSLNLPLEASILLVHSLQAKIAASAPASRWRGARGGGGSGHPLVAAAAAAPAGVYGAPGLPGEGESQGGGLSLEERQLLLNERLQASREAEAAQSLAERRLKMMEEMRASGDGQIVTEQVLQNRRSPPPPPTSKACR
ncbi:unnamed protein product [Scytosiphon promiscuus]